MIILTGTQYSLYLCILLELILAKTSRWRQSAMTHHNTIMANGDSAPFIPRLCLLHFMASSFGLFIIDFSKKKHLKLFVARFFLNRAFQDDFECWKSIILLFFHNVEKKRLCPRLCPLADARWRGSSCEEQRITAHCSSFGPLCSETITLRHASDRTRGTSTVQYIQYSTVQTRTLR